MKPQARRAESGGYLKKWCEPVKQHHAVPVRRIANSPWNCMRGDQGRFRAMAMSISPQVNFIGAAVRGALGTLGFGCVYRKNLALAAG